MRVAIDARPATGPVRTGVGTYTWHLIRHLPYVDPETKYLAWYLYFRRLLGNPLFFQDVTASNFEERWSPFPARVFWRLSRREAPRVEWLVGFDLFLATNFVPPPTRKPFVTTVHDLTFRRYPRSVPEPTRRWLSDKLRPALRRAEAVLVPSEATRRDLLELEPVNEETVFVTPLAVDRSRFRRPPVDDIVGLREQLGVDGPYLLYVGGIEPRKNVPALIRAFGRLSADLDVRLVVAGAPAPWDTEGWKPIEDAIDQLHPYARDRVKRTGYLTEPNKAALLAGAEAFVFPSLYEGFGLPPLEAMALGTPVVASDIAALRETGGEAALYADTGNADALAEGIRRVIEDEALRRRLRDEGPRRAAAFRWDDTARRTAAVLKRVGERIGSATAGI